HDIRGAYPDGLVEVRIAMFEALLIPVPFDELARSSLLGMKCCAQQCNKCNRSKRYSFHGCVEIIVNYRVCLMQIRFMPVHLLDASCRPLMVFLGYNFTFKKAKPERDIFRSHQ